MPLYLVAVIVIPPGRKSIKILELGCGRAAIGIDIAGMHTFQIELLKA